MPEPLHDSHYSIGRAAAMSGISSATLRMWERRYGRPVPVRLPSGHRRYTAQQVGWLRRVSEALALGIRASEAVQADEEALARLLDRAEGRAPDAETHRLVRLAREFRSREFLEVLRTRCASAGPRAFVLDHVAPLTLELGRAWADGRLEVRHEHHATSQVDDLLRALRQTLTPPDDGPVMVLTTLPGEGHGLGLQMVAILAVLHRIEVHVLGTETPVEEIAEAARETGAAAVGIGVSLSSGGPETDRVLADLSAALPEHTRIVAGGAGARRCRRGPRCIEYVDDLRDADRWLAELRRAYEERGA